MMVIKMEMVKWVNTPSYRGKFFHFVECPSKRRIETPIGQETSIVVKDDNGELVTFHYRVTCDMSITKSVQWIYGQVLNIEGDASYYQIEIKTDLDDPNYDNVAVFPKAPPIKFKNPAKS